MNYIPIIGKHAICSYKRTYAALSPWTIRRGGKREAAWVKDALCSRTPLTVCFFLAALAEGAVVGRRGAISKKYVCSGAFKSARIHHGAYFHPTYFDRTATATTTAVDTFLQNLAFFFFFASAITKKCFVLSPGCFYVFQGPRGGTPATF